MQREITEPLPLPEHYNPEQAAEVGYHVEDIDALERFEAAGVHLVESTTPLEEWPGGR